VHQLELEMQNQELQRSRHEVEESRDRYRELYESLPLGYATIDLSGQIYDLNPAGTKLLGFPDRTRHVKKSFFHFCAEDADAATLFFRTVLSEQSPDARELHMRTVDDRPFIAAVQAAPAQVSGEKEKRLRITFEDITRRKEIEEQLRQQHLLLTANRVELQALMGKLFTAQEEERRRIACDLHDDHCQRLTALILETGSWARLFASTNSTLVPRIELLKQQLTEILDDFRHLSHELHPRHLDTVPLGSSMRSHIKELAEHTGLRIDFQERDVHKELPLSIVISLYRLLQESLANIRKHACATHVSVTLSGGPHHVELLVADNGSGFDLGAVATSGKGLGLTSMQERVRPLGGRVAITSRPGHGTKLTISIPLSTSPVGADGG
jgi:PAS domain S-box-containing protein